MSECPERIVVAGSSGSGKTTLCRVVAQRLELPFVEIDSLFHGPDWTPRCDFVDDVAAFIARPRWVFEYGYGSVRDAVAARASVIVWLDVPIWQSYGALLRRTLMRSARREVLWNGNIEPPLTSVLTDSEHILRYAWRHRDKYRRLVPAAVQANPGVRLIHCRTRDDAYRWLDSVAP
ncbi:AAA family ATPase [Williamsia sp. CHRR-6]|uniref:AAA family ATPase n=1 Tax=Williamsia sp. CHRR-6 TaxID=2835871 RepID=UPI001BDA8516|nr:AAA family ATPase [Williamsia sp. CHRR-6]MBT0568180.1 AAA family ATPase [Williamsia sp. CHRR-6]